MHNFTIKMYQTILISGILFTPAGIGPTFRTHRTDGTHRRTDRRGS